MKIKAFLIILTLLCPSAILASEADVNGDISSRKYIIARSNDCVKKVRKMEMDRKPNTFPTFDAYVISWRAKLFSNDNDSVRTPKFRFKGDAQDIEAYKKCMGE